MKSSSRLGGAVAATALLMSAGGALARVNYCPERCSVSGPNTGNWSAYPNMDKISRCPETLFYDFSIYDPVDDQGVNHRVLACSSYGPDFASIPSSPGLSAASMASAQTVGVDYQVGWWSEDDIGLQASAIRGLLKQARQYLDNGHGPSDRPVILFAQYGAATMGLFVGQDLQKQHAASTGLKIFEDYLDSDKIVASPALAMQLCGSGFDSNHIMGVMAMSNATFNPIQDAVKSWANATCLEFLGTHKFSSQAKFTTPLVPLPGPGNSTRHSNGTLAAASSSSSSSSKQKRARLPHQSSKSRLHARAECETIQVVSGDSCAALATRCGISGNDFTKFNPGSDFCAKLVPKQHVCCSAGDLPDFKPHKNSDGSCASYRVQNGDNCGDIAAENSLEMSDLEDFNKATWGWNGCDRLLIDTVMCLSEGDPPFPAPMANAVCGPQVPGTEKPKDGSDIAKLNPCPLNACCDVWGQCGITKEFCTDTGNGAPGTAKAGTNGCISNCGTTIVKGSGDGSQRIAYYQGDALSRKCLFQDALQVDTSSYTHIHFGFGVLTPDYQVHVGNALSSYEFKQFKRIVGPKKILSFGGWAFSTEPATYFIFRQGVTPENRFLMASSIANFIIENDLDGVDIDWEYPGAPDIPGIPPASKDDGLNYLYFLVILKNLLGGKSVSIAAPSSYWYLKQYPIADISRIIDYIVFMTYDLHGQWDAGNSNSQEGCDSGNCLRSQVNLTETQTSLAMITKAGVPAEKVVVGITSYGRSFKMAVPGCYGPNCLFTGDINSPGAAPGVCTNAAGILANAEIANIISGTDVSGLAARSGRVTADYVDPTSNSRILVYDDVQWVDYMDDSIKAIRQTLYKGLGFAGTTDWASDLQEFHDPPRPVTSWAELKEAVMNGKDPKVDDSTHGNWTDIGCDDDHIQHLPQYYPSDTWKAVDCYDAWQDAVNIYKTVDKDENQSFSVSVAYTLGMETGRTPHCEKLLDSSTCAVDSDCHKSAASQLVWNSLVAIKTMMRDYQQALLNSFAAVDAQLAHLEDTFAPVPPEPDNTLQDLILDLLSFGIGGVAGRFVKTYLSGLAYFLKNEGALHKVEGVADTVIEQGLDIAKGLFDDASQYKWSIGDQQKFSALMGQTVWGWANVTAFTLDKLFDGSDESIEKLGSMIADGQLIGGKQDNPPPSGGDSLLTDVLQSIFAYAIPTLWRISGTFAFVMDSGLSCSDDQKSLSIYLDDKTREATGHCDSEHDRMYYLVQPKGDSKSCPCTINPNGICSPSCNKNNPFSAPEGLDSLDGTDFGQIKLEDLIMGSVNTYVANGNKNSDDTTVTPDTGSVDQVMTDGIRAPGFIRLPVCSPERAYQGWDKAKPGSTPNFPCDDPPSKTDCNSYTFEPAISDNSPTVAVCKGIIDLIKGDIKTEWTTQVSGRPTRRIAQHDSCSLVVQAANIGKNTNFKVGGQDVANMINLAASLVSGDLMQGSGTMKCHGDLRANQSVSWWIQPS